MASIAPGANATMMSPNRTGGVSAITATKIAEMTMATANEPSAGLTWLRRTLGFIRAKREQLRGGHRDHRDEDRGDDNGAGERAQARIHMAEQDLGLHPRKPRADQRADPDQRNPSHPWRQAALDQSGAVQHACLDPLAEQSH